MSYTRHAPCALMCKQRIRVWDFVPLWESCFHCVLGVHSLNHGNQDEFIMNTHMEIHRQKSQDRHGDDVKYKSIK